MIASLELLAVLVAVMVFVPYQPLGVVDRAAFGCSAGTDSKGNTSVVQRYMCTKFLLRTVLMELSCQLAERGLGLAPKRGQPACRCLDQQRLLGILSRKTHRGPADRSQI